MRTLSSILQIARRVLHQDKAWLFFVECPAPIGFFRLVKASRHVVADGKTWQAASIEIGLPAEDAEGSLGTLTIGVPNVSRLPITYLEVDGFPLGETVTVYLQHESNLEIFEPALSWSHTVLRAKANETLLELDCGHPAEIQRVPSRRFDRQRFPQLLPVGGFRL